uniref:uncharacterized protein LOC122601165 n=1 Tax=Erigeron canadensis TaxID=72917 RepID=UPI001CB89B89|nr:uncharacterized protein LOC122601165 [Erigeron canadensis]
MGGLSILYRVLTRYSNGKCQTDLKEKQTPPIHLVITSTSIKQPDLCRHFQFNDILSATENFDESLVIGHGGFGKVYKGKIIMDTSSSVVAAIKRLDTTSGQGAAEFWAEVETLSMLRHCNLVSLIGYCKHGKELILVYEYIPNGTLEDHLHKLGTPLSWFQRLKICIGAGRGLHYLHTGTGIESGVIHRDVKSSNILLHEGWAAKISDFGLSKIGSTNQPTTYVNTLVKGTFGYLDPDYFTTGKLTRKSDVYAFGVVMLEMLCRKRALDKSRHEEQWNLARWVQKSIKERNLKQIVDSGIKGEIAPKGLKEFVRIAERCLCTQTKKRLTMAEVLVSLENLLILQEKYNYSLQPAGKTLLARMINMLPVISNAKNSAQGCSKLSRDYRISSLKKFEFDVLRKSTNDFSLNMIIGEGDFETTYIGWFNGDTFTNSKHGDEVVVAVKKLHYFQEHVEWMEGLRFLGQVAHPNIITLLGYCSDESQQCLVFEYMPNKSLDHFIFTDIPNHINEPLSWRTRIMIMIGVARGLVYLHSSNEKIIHGDLRSSNILLDEDFNAKLGGFSLPKFIPWHVKRRVISLRRIPVYVGTGIVSVKDDIYSFGAVLLEALTGLRVIDRKCPTKLQILVDWPILEKGEKLKKIMDPRLEQNYPVEGAFDCTSLALRCLVSYPKDRPSSEEVLQVLEQILSENKGNSGTASNIIGADNNTLLDTIEHPAAYKIPSLQKFEIDVLQKSTNDFSQDMIIGEGGYGRTYLGWVNENSFTPSKHGDGVIVAVKRLHCLKEHAEWQEEVSFLGQLAHPNIVTLLGYCSDDSQQCLVFKYMPNKSFDRFIFTESGFDLIKKLTQIAFADIPNHIAKPLSWGTRLMIMIGVARGLVYLHSLKEKIIHRDIKSANIFLDEVL